MTATNPRSASPWSVQRTADWLADRVLRETGVEAEDLDRDMTFSAIGLGSTAVTALIAELGRQYGRPIPVTAAWSFPTVNGLALAVVSGEAESLKNAAGSEDRIRHADTVRGGSDEPLAVVSMAVRLPGADTLAELWKQVLDGAEAIGPPPANRLGSAAAARSGEQGPGLLRAGRQLAARGAPDVPRAHDARRRPAAVHPVHACHGGRTGGGGPRRSRRTDRSGPHVPRRPGARRLLDPPGRR
ncbi:hypothetical protein GT016_00095 [Streptomyces sp. SID3915]|nr:hypothetical protein [Streptomyces sp. SID3915]